MLITIKLILCTTLIVIACSDFRSRTIPVYALLMAIVSGTLILFIENDFITAVTNILVNTCIIFIQLMLITLYFCTKYRRFINIFNYFLGIGDLLFFLVLALCFSPANLILFMLFSELVIIIFYFPLRKTALIPLAGLMAIILFVLFISDIITQQFRFYSDSSLIDIVKI